MDPYQIALIGVGSTIAGALVGAWISNRLNYGFQKKLLEQQLAFQQQLSDADAAARQQMHKEMKGTVQYLRDTINERGKQIGAKISAL